MNCTYCKYGKIYNVYRYEYSDRMQPKIFDNRLLVKGNINQYPLRFSCGLVWALF